MQRALTPASLFHIAKGNVPANYRTNDKPPRSLGRWINRQRSAYTKNKLKKEYVDKLNSLGLRWTIHERKPLPPTVSPTSNGGPDALKSENGVEAAKSETGDEQAPEAATKVAIKQEPDAG